jgi:hypothetical protein
VDVHRAVLEIDLGPGESERFGDAGAGPDEQFGEGSIVRGAGIEVAVDLGEPEVVELGLLDGQWYDELAGLRGNSSRRLASASAPESAARALLMVFAEIAPDRCCSIIRASQSRTCCSLISPMGTWARWGRRRLRPCVSRSSSEPSVR